MMETRSALVTAGVVGVAAVALTQIGNREESDDSDESSCPICGKSVDPRGLSGHLQFGHGVAGEDVSKVISSGSAESMEVTNESA